MAKHLLKLHKTQAFEEDQLAKPSQNFKYVKCYHSSSPRHIKSPCNSIRNNCQKICSWSRRPETILKITQKSKINKPIIYKSLKDFTNHRKKTNRAVVFSHGPLPNILKHRDHRWELPTVWKTWFLQTYWRVWLVCLKVRLTLLQSHHRLTIRTRDFDKLRLVATF